MVSRVDPAFEEHASFHAFKNACQKSKCNNNNYFSIILGFKNEEKSN